MANLIKVVAISGSLRRDSYNTAALRAAMELKPEGMTISLADFRDLPLYSDEIDGDATPEVVRSFKAQIRGADGILIASPEYNFSIPGGLKNAIDWVSRGPVAMKNDFANKPVAILGASGGLLGTARMQYHLRQVLGALDAHLLNKPEVMISQAPSKFDASGKLTDDATREVLKKQLAAFEAWIHRLK